MVAPVAATLRRMFASVLAWLVGAAASVGVGLVALSLIGDGTSARSVQPLTPDAVAREVSAAPTPSQPSPAGPSPTVPRSAAPQTRPGGAHTDRAVTSPGGTVVARCDAAGAYLLSWSPAQGYRADDVHRGPAPEVWLQFESLTGAFHVTVRCVGGVPQSQVRQDDDGGHDG